MLIGKGMAFLCDCMVVIACLLPCAYYKHVGGKDMIAGVKLKIDDE